MSLSADTDIKRINQCIPASLKNNNDLKKLNKNSLWYRVRCCDFIFKTEFELDVQVNSLSIFGLNIDQHSSH